MCDQDEAFVADLAKQKTEQGLRAQSPDAPNNPKFTLYWARFDSNLELEDVDKNAQELSGEAEIDRESAKDFLKAGGPFDPKALPHVPGMPTWMAQAAS
eukprot:8935054-Alexandrium_andersonii.AAC.1